MKCFRFTLISLILIAASCDKPAVSNIPYSNVWLELDLANLDKGLIPLTAHRTFTQEDIGKRIGVYATGFGGVLVYHGIDNSYYAFDAACPYEGNSNVKVKVDEANLFAICPKCNSKYDLSTGIGNPAIAPHKHQLHKYSLQKAGNKLIVRN